MTQDDAKTKWCPFVRFHIEGKAPTFTVAPNRDQRGTRCIASACMAWRGKETRGFVMKAEDEFRRTGKRLAPTDSDLEGYCGLAGPVQ